MASVPDTAHARPVYGVDFSAAAGDAGTKTWIARGIAANGTLTLTGVEPLATGAALDDADRATALPALAAWLRGIDDRAVAGLDFPFGLPRFIVEAAGHDSWRSFLSGFPDTLGGGGSGHDDAAADPVRVFAERCVDLTDQHGEGTYDNRQTDAAVGARSPYGFIADTITFYGMRDVLAPIIDDVRIAPMDVVDHLKGNGLRWRPDAPAGPTIVETYPAAVFEALGLHRTRYKGTSDVEATRRRQNAEGIVATGDVTYNTNADLVDRIVANHHGDALDAVAACLGAFVASETEYAVTTDEFDDPAAIALEGYIYALRDRR